MAIYYESVVPWGRSYQEYVRMFGLTDVDLDKRILGCGDGPASFNCAMHRRGKRVVSIDPVYHLTAREIESRIAVTYQTVLAKTRESLDRFVWTQIESVEHLGRIRMAAMREFLEDFETGKAEGRYVAAELPDLPFETQRFDICLSSHFLFLYANNLSLEFHLQAIGEMLRVSREIRIFPLLDVNADPSPYVEEVAGRYLDAGYGVEAQAVEYEFQKGGDTMLRIWKP